MTDKPWLLFTPPAPERWAPKSGREDIHSFVWKLWPWVNWLLPVIAILCIGNNGWGMLLLLFASPLLVPVLGLLGSLPRFILRKSGITTTPAPITSLLFVQWWAVITAMITPPGITDGRPIPPLMQGLSLRPISGDYLSMVLLVGTAIVVACWIAVLTIASITASRKRASDSKRWTVVAWVAVAVLPLMFVATILLGGAVTAQQRDAAGDTVAEVQAQPLNVQAQRALERHERAQAQLALVRGLIAEDGWQVSLRGFDDRTTLADAVDGYGVGIAFEYEPSATDAVDVSAIEAELRQQGWTVDADGSFIDPDGNTVEIDEYEGVIEVSLVSPRWWGDSYELSDELGVYDGQDEVRARTYTADEWPAP